MFKVIQDRPTVEQTFRSLVAALNRDSKPFDRKLGWKGGGGDFQIRWSSKHRFWHRLDPNQVIGRYWLVFGTDDPTQAGSLALICEINPPLQGVNRRCAGVFLEDEYGNRFLAHTGRVGGGRTGIGKESFLSSQRGSLHDLVWPDGKHSDVVLVGQIKNPRFQAQVACFVRDVERFKKAVEAGQESKTQSSAKGFSPEFSGRKQPYRRSITECQCDHGLVVNTLASVLEERGFSISNDRQRDLAAKIAGQRPLLFEAKTTHTPQDVYTAVGQLLMHGTAERRIPTLVMVLPGDPSPDTERVLTKLGITVLPYTIRRQHVEFDRIDKVLDS